MSQPKLLRYGILAFFSGIGAGDALSINLSWLLFIFILSFLLFFATICLGNKNSAAVVLVICVSFFIGIFRISVSAKAFDVNDIAFYRESGYELDFEGSVIQQPEIRNNAQYVLLESRAVIYGNSRINVAGKILVKVKKYPGYGFGDYLVLKGEIKRPAEFEDFSYADYLAKDQIYAVVYNPEITLVEKNRQIGFFAVIYWLKENIKSRVEALMPAPGASIAIGLLIGARASIPQNILDDFQKTGLTHILAISGYNITLIINIFALILKSRGRRFRFWTTCLAIGVFAVLTGLSASVVRASLMGAFVVLSFYVGRKSDGLQMLLLSGFFMVAVNPAILLRDISFQLSFLSTLGLLLFLPVIEDYFNRLPKFIGEGLAVTLAATFFTTPVILYNFDRLSLISPLANVIFLPLIPLIMLSSFCAVIVSILFSPMAYLISGITWIFLFLLVEGVGIIARIPFAMVEIPGFSWWMVFVYYGILLFVIRSFRKSRSGQGGFSCRFQF